MSRSTPSQAPDIAAGRTIKLADIISANTSKLVDEVAAKLGVKFGAITDLAKKRLHLLDQAVAKDLLHESQCAKVVQDNPEMRSELAAVKLAAHEAQQNAAAAAALAQEAMRAAQDTAGSVSALQVEVRQLQAKLDTILQQQTAVSKEAADAPLQQQLEPQAICFNLAVAGGEVQGGPAEQLAAVRSALQSAHIPSHVTDTIVSVQVLRKHSPSDEHSPIVLRCSSLTEKIALLRAVRDANGTHGGQLRVFARLTRLQQERRKGMQQARQALTDSGVKTRFFKGYILQRLTGNNRWEEVSGLPA